MGLPDVVSNYKGYAESDIFEKVEHLRDKMFYLVHGTADDNVQFQQSMALTHHLAQKGILFRQQVLFVVMHTNILHMKVRFFFLRIIRFRCIQMWVIH